MSDARKHSENMDWLAPDSARERFDVTRYSFFVNGMKVVLPSLALALLVAVMLWSSGNSPSIKSNRTEAVDATMRDAVYESRDENKNPYKIIAPVARQNPDAPGMVDLTNPTSTIDMGTQGSITANSKNAQYDQNTGTLNVQGDVVLSNQAGTTFKTESAQVDVNNHTVNGDKPVVLEGSFGVVRGQGIQVTEGGKIITFTGQSSAKLNLGSGGGITPSLAMQPITTQTTPTNTAPATK